MSTLLRLKGSKRAIAMSLESRFRSLRMRPGAGTRLAFLNFRIPAARTGKERLEMASALSYGNFSAR